MNSVLPFAKEMLGKHREFFPYSFAPDGKLAVEESFAVKGKGAIFR